MGRQTDRQVLVLSSCLQEGQELTNVISSNAQKVRRAKQGPDGLPCQRVPGVERPYHGRHKAEIEALQQAGHPEATLA